mgnify:FL=1
MQRKPLFLQGARDTLPILIGVAPFGMIYGVLAVKAGLAVAAAQGMSVILFAGSAQFMLVQLLGAGTPWFVAVASTFIINLRHALYSASDAPHTQRLSPLWKSLLAYVLVDEVYAVAITNFERSAPRGGQHWYMLGSGLALWAGWQAGTALGIFLGAQIPEGLSLDFTLVVTFIALLVPTLKDRPMLLAALAAGMTAVAANGLPYKIGLLLATLVGIVVGLWSERAWQKPG